MPVTDDQARAIAYLAAACRPGNAPHWEAPGILAAIQRVKDRKLAEVVHAFIRAAEDPTARTPNVIVTNPDYWREKSPHRELAHPPKSAEACDTCGRHERSCVCPADERRRRESVPPTPAWSQARAELRAHEEETR